MNITKKFLTKNEYSRPDRKLHFIKAIIIHWVSKPGQRAYSVWKYWEDRKEGNTGYGSGHYIVDLNGDILHCIPNDEMAYHVGSRFGYTSHALKTLSSYPNNCTIAIELTHLDSEGSFSDETFDSAAELTASLCIKYGLDPFEGVMTHKYVVGWKDCPKWFSDHPEDFDGFRSKVKQLMS